MDTIGNPNVILLLQVRIHACNASCAHVYTADRDEDVKVWTSASLAAQDPQQVCTTCREASLLSILHLAMFNLVALCTHMSITPLIIGQAQVGHILSWCKLVWLH